MGYNLQDFTGVQPEGSGTFIANNKKFAKIGYLKTTTKKKNKNPKKLKGG